VQGKVAAVGESMTRSPSGASLANASRQGCPHASSVGDPHMPAEDVTKHGKVLRQWRMRGRGGWSDFPLLFIFILLFIVPS
jgi:hypothetical protein